MEYIPRSTRFASISLDLMADPISLLILSRSPLTENIIGLISLENIKGSEIGVYGPAQFTLRRLTASIMSFFHHDDNKIKGGKNRKLGVNKVFGIEKIQLWGQDFSRKSNG